MSFVTANLYCACASFPNASCINGVENPSMVMSRYTARSPRDTFLFGRENFNSAYGEAFMLGFPAYRGCVYVQSLPVAGCAVPSSYRYGYPAGTPLVAIGSSSSPYFVLAPKGPL